MKFRYNARTKQGELQTGFVEAANREAAINVLTGHDLVLLSLVSAEALPWYKRLVNIFERVKSADVMVFTRQFATFLEAKISLGDALRNLYKQTKNPILKEIISEVSSDIDAGLSLSQALKKHPGAFSEFYVSMVSSAEITGRLEEVIGFLAEYLEKEAGLVSRIRNALIYPIIVIILFGVVGGVLIGFVFPQLAPVFQESGVELPLITRILLGSGDFLTNWWLAIAITLGVIVFVIYDYLRTEEGKIILDEVRLRVPILGNLYKKLYVARFAESVAVLIRGGLPVAQAIEISGRTIGSPIYSDILHKIAESVRGGELMSQALQEHDEFFPPLVSQMVSVGESTGKLEALLSRVSSFYSREVDDLIGRLVELIQPALMVFIGIAVGVLFVAILLPIFNLTRAF